MGGRAMSGVHGCLCLLKRTEKKCARRNINKTATSVHRLFVKACIYLASSTLKTSLSNARKFDCKLCQTKRCARYLSAAGPTEVCIDRPPGHGRVIDCSPSRCPQQDVNRDDNDV